MEEKSDKIEEAKAESAEAKAKEEAPGKEPPAAAPAKPRTFASTFCKIAALATLAAVVALIALLVDRGCIEDEEELVWESTSYTTSATHGDEAK